MKEKGKIFIYIGLIIISILIIVLILLNTIFYDYKGKFNTYLNNYYTINVNDLSDINNLILRYKNNTSRTNNITQLLEEDIEKRINDFNTSYKNIDTLSSQKDILKEKIIYLLDTLPDSINLKLKKDHYIKLIDNLYNSKEYYLKGLEFFNENDYNQAYDNFKNVITTDSYYEDTTNKIDGCFDLEIKNIKDELDNMEDENEEQLKINTKKFNYLIEKKNNVIFDLTKSKTYTNLLNEVVNKLIEEYINISSEKADNNEYDDASSILSEGINLLTKENIDASKLITKKDEYTLMKPVSLIDIDSQINGEAIKEKYAITDKDNNTYSNAINVYKNSNSSIIYNINKEYKYLKATLNISDQVEKNKRYGKVKIYFDDKEVYSSSDITSNFQKKDIKLELTDVNNVKIEYTSNNASNSSSDILIFIIGNPTLEKY